MSTVNDRKFIDNIIAHDGFYGGDDEESPDNPRCVKIVEYTNMGGRRTWGLIFDGFNPDKYCASEFVVDPQTIWEWRPKT